ncbi:phosphoribosylformylglycinamidine synthase [Aureococcus anophagefferens]|nr:phosphoribosylformylglycinamidine synthase [Aureococcus anophagefferens]
MAATESFVAAALEGGTPFRLYRRGVVDEAACCAVGSAIASATKAAGPVAVQAEHCFNVTAAAMSAGDARAAAKTLVWLLSETYAPEDVGAASFLGEAVSVEPALRVRRGGAARAVADHVHDRMTECVYEGGAAPFFAEAAAPAADTAVGTVDVVARGAAALKDASDARGLGFDAFDVEYYADLFATKLGRDPTDVELYDMSQSNSEHSRHWFFSGRQVVDGVEKDKSLFRLVKATLEAAKAAAARDGRDDVSVIAFHDNSSAIAGGAATRTLHSLLTAETHNFPCAVAPLPGAETGAGGRLRDVQATGRGAHAMAGVAGYCVGNLLLDGHAIAGEDPSRAYPAHLASPRQILRDASEGASDYGNKFGEPVVCGYCRSFGGVDAAGDRCEWLKPVMFSAGVGWLDARHCAKNAAAPGMAVVKVGGPAYRIGLGGGAASSRVSTAERADLDFNAVQRGDAQMLNRMNRVIRACAERGAANPIVSIHDQGCGGNGNVLKEIVETHGARYDLARLSLGDATMTPLELWGAEYQESNALLVDPRDIPLLRAMAERERCHVDVVGEVAADGRVVVVDSRGGSDAKIVDLPLELVLADMPKKVFESTTPDVAPTPLNVAAAALFGGGPPDFRAALEGVLGLPAVCSKRFLVHKADRSVTGLVARQQCVGPFQLPLSNCAVLARSHFSTEGVAVAVGEAPQLSALSPARMARRAVCEMLTNLLEGEGSRMYAACEAMCDALMAAGCAVDGGKDSLSMAASDGAGAVVKAPGALTLTAYAPCVDVARVLTCDLKADDGVLVLVDLAGAPTLDVGGSALAQALGQLGRDAPESDATARAFDAVQALHKAGDLLSLHDRSDGGLVTCVLEMAFAGGRGVTVDAPRAATTEGDVPPAWAALFHEAPGLVLEVAPERVAAVLAAFKAADVGGRRRRRRRTRIAVAGAAVLDAPVLELWAAWEATAFAMERVHGRDGACVDAEMATLAARTPPKYAVPFAAAPAATTPSRNAKPVAILRCEGSNGDREMATAFHLAGLEPWDVAVADVASGAVTLDRFRGIAFVGGFSYADVLDSAKGWAGAIRFNDALRPQFEAFRARSDVFSLGVCNGCQLLALLGWVPGLPACDAAYETQPRFVHNASRKFESRWLSVAVLESPAKLLAGMAGATLGVWVAHGEGRAHFPDADVERAVFDGGLAPVRYADDAGEPTDAYPFCPNGAARGAAALCSPCGKHLAMMPHPERCVLPWQWPYKPPGLPGLEAASPWMKLFQNAKTFLDAVDRDAEDDCAPVPGCCN